MKTDYTREELIKLCEEAIIPEELWHDRDSASAQAGIGKAWAYLKAGCPFKVLKEKADSSSGDLVTDEHTIWVELSFNGFSSFESTFDETMPRETDTIYIPTRKRIEEGKGGDWY